MKKVDYRCLPPRSPFLLTIIFWLLLDRLASPGWVWGVYITTCILFWAGYIWAIMTTDFVNLFEEPEKTNHGKLESILRKTSYYNPPDQKVH